VAGVLAMAKSTFFKVRFHHNVAEGEIKKTGKNGILLEK
jgi:hypothetical protein